MSGTSRPAVVHVHAPTERRNPDTTTIDQLDALGVLRAINNQDATVPGAVAAVLPELARLVDLAVAALRAGHRVHYVGAGTSGRLAVLDVAELVPTFNIPADWFVAHPAGGPTALLAAVEGAEDDDEAGALEMERHVRRGDVVVGLAASGRTPFVLGALAAARRIGAPTALVSADPNAEANQLVDVPIAVDTGPEAIAGSTRMKAGTAQKLVLTAFSTAVMVRFGRTYSNLMVSLRATNAKLRGRTLRILREASGASERDCADALSDADGDLKVALVRLLSGTDVGRATAALDRAKGHVRTALAALGPATAT
ncbi:MAG TPA: N-acetylmuramic acid 6-phosphate etherase [Pseudonocardiaceae bacterium]|jgi:N-acetylmuramic acid 6-phosphate etherase|nr:N-acetylmuramic acid 6-phosphate etherase [Pseudonocardiaceae bacterium]